MRTKRFLISSLALAGFLPPQNAMAALSTNDPSLHTDERQTLSDVFKLDHVYTLAGHRSHSSHSSHSSHRSSSSGGYTAPVYRPPVMRQAPAYAPPPVYSAPAPVYSAPAPATAPAPSPARIFTQPTAPQTPAAIAPKTLPGNSNKFSKIVIQVQTALFAYGYYDGTIDGVIGPQSKAALSEMQSQYGLPITGTINPDVLNALGITAE